MKTARFLLGVLAAFGGACDDPCTLDTDCDPGSQCVNGACEKIGGADGTDSETLSPIDTSTESDSQSDTATQTADAGLPHGNGGVVVGDSEEGTDTADSGYAGRCDMVNFCVEYTDPLWTSGEAQSDCEAVLGYFSTTERCDRGPNCNGECIVPGEKEITIYYHSGGAPDPEGCLALEGEFSAVCSDVE